MPTAPLDRPLHSIPPGPYLGTSYFVLATCCAPPTNPASPSPDCHREIGFCLRYPDIARVVTGMDGFRLGKDGKIPIVCPPSPTVLAVQARARLKTPRRWGHAAERRDPLPKPMCLQLGRDLTRRRRQPILANQVGPGAPQPCIRDHSRRLPADGMGK